MRAESEKAEKTSECFHETDEGERCGFFWESSLKCWIVKGVRVESRPRRPLDV